LAIVDGPAPDAGGTSLYDRIHAVEVETITWALRASGGNKSKAAALLQVKRSTLGDRIKKLDLGHLESFDADSSQAAE
jgi:transcriptional regulator with PAS, ATPase and Fis domain